MNATLNTAELPSRFHVIVGSGGKREGDSSDGEPSIIFNGTSAEMLAEGGKSPPDRFQGGSGGGFPDLPGGDGGSLGSNGTDGRVDGIRASGGGGGSGGLFRTGGAGGSVGDRSGGLASGESLRFCCEGFRCVGGGGASTLGRGGELDLRPGIGGGAAGFGDGGDGAVFITLLD